MCSVLYEQLHLTSNSASNTLTGMCPEKDFNLILMCVKRHILHPLHHEKTQRSCESHDDHHEELPGQQNITTVEERHSCKNRLREGAFNWHWIEFISNTLPLFNGQGNFKCIFSFMCQTEGKLLMKHRFVFFNLSESLHTNQIFYWRKPVLKFSKYPHPCKPKM